MSDVTALVITLDEEPNIERTLAALRWVGRVLVLDSGSTDRTLDIARREPNVTVLQRAFDSFAGQCNYGLDRIGSGLVLSLDADHVVTPALAQEIARLDPAGAAAWQARFRYCIDGRPLRASLLPPRAVLFHAGLARYVDDGHAHRLVAHGPVASLRGEILHDDRKPYARWLAAQRRYAAQEADKLTRTPWRELGLPDKVRWLGLGPWAVVPYCLFAKGLLLDGAPGLEYSHQRFTAEWQLFRQLLARRLARVRA
jgi:glycosyltransferase involved in cell wall biosynthesis